MIIKMTRGFSLKGIAERLLASNTDLVLILPPAQTIQGHARCIEDPIHQQLGQENRFHARQNVELIVPMRGETRYDASGIPVHRFATPKVHTLLGDKLLFSQALRDDPYHLPTMPATKAEQIQDAVQTLRKDHQAACIKPRKGVNGNGYWTFWTGDPIALLNEPDRRQIALHHYLAGAVKSIIDHVVMPWLPGPEVTFDVLCHEGKMLAWCTRTKNDENEDQMMDWQHPLQDHVAQMVRKFKLNGLVGIQYRKSERGEWKILEINDRPCGGVVKSEDAGAGLIEQWGGLLSGRLKPSQVQHRPVHGVMRSERRYRYTAL